MSVCCQTDPGCRLTVEVREVVLGSLEDLQPVVSAGLYQGSELGHLAGPAGDTEYSRPGEEGGHTRAICQVS